VSAIIGRFSGILNKNMGCNNKDLTESTQRAGGILLPFLFFYQSLLTEQWLQ
jgi:hypothetical protein